MNKLIVGTKNPSKLKQIQDALRSLKINRQATLRFCQKDAAFSLGSSLAERESRRVYLPNPRCWFVKKKNSGQATPAKAELGDAGGTILFSYPN